VRIKRRDGLADSVIETAGSIIGKTLVAGRYIIRDSIVVSIDIISSSIGIGSL